MTTEIQQNRYDQLLRRVCGMIGTGSKVAEGLSELFPTIDVERVPAELLILMGTRTCMGGGTITGAAGQAGKAQLFNPVDSGMLITLTDIHISCGVNTTVRWGVANQILGGHIQTQRFTDTRKSFTQLPVGQVHQLSAVALAPATNQTRVLAVTDLWIQTKGAIAILSPGHGLTVGVDENATTIFFGFNWRERPAEPSELEL